ncbi:hypothetical protein KHA80_18950 [Anaerobacillus sp. HL2]|nr:hypothetical protein KHA80_18950 [Anaerobacillus sp. HL2]
MRKIGLSLIIILFIIAIKFHNTFFMDNLLQNEDQISLVTPIVEKEVNQELSNASNPKDKQLKLLKEDGLHTLIGEKKRILLLKIW